MTRESGGRRTGLALFGGVFVGAMVATAMVWTLRTPTESPVRRFRLPLAGTGLVSSVAISPDGGRIAFSRDGSLWLRELDHLEPRAISDAGDTDAVFWSPDSAWVGHGSGGKLWKVPAGGGEAMVICALPDGHRGTATSGAWTPDGRIVFTTDETGLLEVSEEDGEVVPFLELQEGEDSYRDVSALPYGRGYLYIIQRNPANEEGAAPSLHSLALVSGNTRKVFHEGQGHPLANPVYSPTGHILFQGGPDEPGIWALPFNLTGLEATGEPFLVASGGGLPTVSRDETLVYLEATDAGAHGPQRGVVVVENWFAEAGRGE
jgi:WD40 repeat protein